MLRDMIKLAAEKTQKTPAAKASTPSARVTPPYPRVTVQKRFNPSASKTDRSVPWTIPQSGEQRTSQKIYSPQSRIPGALGLSFPATPSQPKVTAQQRKAYSPVQQEKPWFRGEAPTLGETITRIYDMASGDPQLGEELYRQTMGFASTPGTPIYSPYLQPTNTAVAQLAALGLDVSGGVNQDWLDRYAPLMANYRTGSTGSPLAPSNTSTPANDAAYWYYKAAQAEEVTQKAEAEWAALQEELTYWAQRPDRNYSDQEILDRIDWSEYPTLQRMDEGRQQGVPVALNRAVGYSTDAMYGTLWAARNGGGTGNAMADCVSYYSGRGSGWTENPEIAARLDPTSDAYCPYAVGSTFDEAALYFGVPSFSPTWLEENRAILAGDDETARKMYARVYDAEQLTLKAEAELAALQEELDALCSLGGVDAQGVLDVIDWDEYPTLQRMDESMQTGEILSLTRAVPFSMRDVENDVHSRFAAAQAGEAAHAWAQEMLNRTAEPEATPDASDASEDAQEPAGEEKKGSFLDGVLYGVGGVLSGLGGFLFPSRPKVGPSVQQAPGFQAEAPEDSTGEPVEEAAEDEAEEAAPEEAEKAHTSGKAPAPTPPAPAATFAPADAASVFMGFGTAADQAALIAATPKVASTAKPAPTPAPPSAPTSTPAPATSAAPARVPASAVGGYIRALQANHDVHAMLQAPDENRSAVVQERVRKLQEMAPFIASALGSDAERSVWATGLDADKTTAALSRQLSGSPAEQGGTRRKAPVGAKLMQAANLLVGQQAERDAQLLQDPIPYMRASTTVYKYEQRQRQAMTYKNEMDKAASVLESLSPENRPDLYDEDGNLLVWNEMGQDTAFFRVDVGDAYWNFVISKDEETGEYVLWDESEDYLGRHPEYEEPVRQRLATYNGLVQLHKAQEDYAAAEEQYTVYQQALTEMEDDYARATEVTRQYELSTAEENLIRAMGVSIPTPVTAVLSYAASYDGYVKPDAQGWSDFELYEMSGVPYEQVAEYARLADKSYAQEIANIDYALEMFDELGLTETLSKPEFSAATKGKMAMLKLAWKAFDAIGDFFSPVVSGLPSLDLEGTFSETLTQNHSSPAYVTSLQARRAWLEEQREDVRYFLLRDTEEYKALLAANGANRYASPSRENDNSVYYMYNDYAINYGADGIDPLMVTDKDTRLVGESVTLAYLRQTYGRDSDEVKAYEAYLDRRIKPRVQARQAEAAHAYAQAHPFAGALESVLFQTVGGLLGGGYSAVTAIQGKDINPYSEWFDVLELSHNERSGSRAYFTDQVGGADTPAGKAVGFLHDATTTLADSSFNMLLAGKGGILLMAASAGASTIQDAKLRGASNEQALMLGGISAVAEAGTEYIFQYNLNNAFRNGAKGFWPALKGVVLSGGVEGVGEGVAELLSIASDDVVLGAQSRLERSIRAYENTGMSPQAAERLATRDSLWQIAYASILGFTVSGMSTTGAYIGHALTANSRVSPRQIDEAMNQLAKRIMTLESAARTGDESATLTSIASVLGSTDVQPELIWEPNAVDEVPAELPPMRNQVAPQATARDANDVQQAPPTPDTTPDAVQQELDAIPAQQARSVMDAVPAAPDASDTAPADSQQQVTRSVMDAVPAAHDFSDAAPQQAEPSLTEGMVDDAAAEVQLFAAEYLAKVAGSAEQGVAVLEQMILVAQEADVPMVSLANAIITAAAMPGYNVSNKLAEIASRAQADSLVEQDLAELITEAYQSRQARPELQQFLPSLANERKISREVQNQISLGALDGIHAFQEALHKSKSEVRLARESATTATQQLRVATENLQTLFSQHIADPANQSIRGSVQQAIKDVEGAVIVQQQAQQALERAKEDARLAGKTLNDQVSQALARVRQTAQETIQQVQEQQAAELAAQQAAQAEAQALQQQAEEEQRLQGNIDAMEAEAFIVENAPDATDEQADQIREQYGEVLQQQGNTVQQPGGTVQQPSAENGVPRSTLNLMTRLSAVFGVKFRVTDGKLGDVEYRGAYLSDGTILISRNATQGDVLIKTLIHELTHRAEGRQNGNAKAPTSKEYNRFADELLDIVYKGDQQQRQIDQDALLARYRAEIGESFTDDDARVELVAMRAEQILGNSDFINRLANEKPSLASRIWQALKRFVRRITGMKGTEADLIRQAEQLYRKALEAARVNTQQQTGVPEVMRFALTDTSGNEVILTGEQIAENNTYVANMDPVATLEGNPMSKDAVEDFFEAGTAYFDSIGGKALNPILGEVALNANGIRHLINRRLTWRKTALLRAVKPVIEQGRILYIDNNHNGRSIDTAIIAAPVLLDDAFYYMGVVVSQNQFDKSNTYEVHDAVIVQKRAEAITPTKTPSTGKDQLRGRDSTPPIAIILSELANYNRQFAQNSDGTRYALPSPDVRRSQMTAFHESMTQQADAFDGAPGPNMGQRQFNAKTGQEAPVLPPWLKQVLWQNRWYEKDTNREQVVRAWQRISAEGYEQVKKRLLDKENWSTDENVEAMIMMHLASRSVEAGGMGDFGLLADFTLRLGEEGTKQGQALQARQIFLKMTPLGMYTWTASSANNAMRNYLEAHKPIEKAAKEQAARITQGIKRLDNSDPLAPNEDGEVVVDPKNLSRWGVPLNQQQWALIRQYHLEGVSRPGIFYNQATLKQRMLEAILATPDPTALTGLGLSLVERLELMRRGAPVATEVDLDYITARMEEFVASNTESDGLMGKWMITTLDEEIQASNTVSTDTLQQFRDAMDPYVTHRESDPIGKAAKAILDMADEMLNGTTAITADTLSSLRDLMQEFQALAPEQVFGNRAGDLALARAYEAYGNITPATFREKFRTQRYVNMLLNLASAGRNIIGNATQGAANSVAHGLAVEIDRFMSLFTKERTMAHHSWQDRAAGWRAFKEETINTYLDYFVDRANTQRVKHRYDMTQRGRVFQNPVQETMRDIEGFFMSVGDRNVWAKTFVQAMAEQQHVADANGVAFNVEAAVERAIQEANYATFTEDNAVRDLINRAKQTKGFGDIVDLIIPFSGVPTNIIKRMWQFSPFSLAINVAGAFKNAIQGKTFNQRELANSIARGVVGTAAFGLGMLLYTLGFLRPGTGDEKDKEYGLHSAMGQQYTHYIRIGGQTVNLAFLSPFIAPYIMGATAAELLEGNDPWYQVVLNSAFAAGDHIFDASYMANVADIFRGYGSPTENISLAVAEAAASQSVPSILSQIASAMDPYVRDTRDKDVIMQLLKGLANKIPGLRQMLPAKVDVAGNRVANTDYGPVAFIDPTNRAQANDDPALLELDRLQESLGNTSFLPADALSGAKNTLTGVDGVVEGADKEAYRIRYGELWRLGGRTYDKNGTPVVLTGVSDLIQTDAYQRMTDAEKAEAISGIVSAAKEGAVWETAERLGHEVKPASSSGYEMDPVRAVPERLAGRYPMLDRLYEQTGNGAFLPKGISGSFSRNKVQYNLQGEDLDRLWDLYQLELDRRLAGIKWTADPEELAAQVTSAYSSAAAAAKDKYVKLYRRK